MYIKKSNKNLTLKFIYLFLFLIAVYVFTLTLSMMIDNNLLISNVNNSINKLVAEGTGRSTFRFYSLASASDNFTDILMLENSLCSLDSKYLYNAMFINNYARYWHGYLVFLKIFLIFTDIQGIRMCNMVIFFGLLMYLLIKLKEKTNSYLFPFSFLLGLIFCYIYIIPISMQYFNAFIITFIISLLVIKNIKNTKKLYLILFLSGSLVNFFDLLTTPMITMGLPIIIYIIINYIENGDSSSRLFKKIVLFSVFWCLGYGGTWLSKWIIGTLVLKQNVIAEGIKNGLFRINGNSNYILDRKDMLRSNILAFFYKKEFFYSFLLLSISSFFFLVIRIKDKIWKLTPLFFVAAYPLIWYNFFGNHSQLHYYMTYRNLIVFFFAMNSFVVLGVKEISESVKNSDVIKQLPLFKKKQNI